MRAATAALVTCSGLAVMTVAGVSVAPIAAANAPGSPGTPSAPVVVYKEDFENVPAASTDTAQSLAAYPGYSGAIYQGAAPLNMTYSADGGWLDAGGSCNGIVVSANANNDGGNGCNAYGQLKSLASSLGALEGVSDNHVLSQYTQGNPGAGIVFKTNSTIPLSTTNRFIGFSVNAAEVNCYASHAQLTFSLVNGANLIPANTTPMDPCGSNTSATSAIVNKLFSNAGILFSGSQLGLQLYNANASGAGNDYAIDDITVLDETPQLDAAFSPASVATNTPATLTYTITNTSELAAKDGWSFSNNLPAGLVYAGNPSTTCTSGGNPATVNRSGSTVSMTADLTAGQTSCTVTVPVQALGSGTYTDHGATDYTLTGLDAPADATLTVTPATGSPSCGFGTSGTAPSSFCWFSFPNYDETQAESANGQHMTIALPNNAGTVSFDLKNTVNNANPGPGVGQVHAVPAPTYGGAQFGNSIYQGVPGKPALYQLVGGSIDTLSLSNIVVKDAAGNPVSGYNIAMADGEATGGNEDMLFGSDQSNLTQVVQPGNPAVCGTAFTGLGTNSVDCHGAVATQGNALVLTSQNATNVTIKQTGGGNEAAIFGIQLASVQGTVTMANRANASDSFSTTVTSPSATVAGPNSTGAAPTNSASTNAYAYPIDGSNPGSYTITTKPDAGTNGAAYVTTWACTNGGNPYNSFTTSADGLSVTVTPAVGDTIVCGSTETFTDLFHTAGGQTTATNTPVTSSLASLAADNGYSPLDPAATSVTTQPAHGTVTIDPTTHQITYTPNPGYGGSDSYLLHVCDQGVPEQCADLTIPVGVGVTANPDSATTNVGTPVNTDVLANDSSTTGQPLASAPTVASQPSHGTASVNPDGTIKYTPAPGFSGADSYAYQICDTSSPAICATATVSVTVNNVFTPGSASTSGVSTPQNQSVTTPLSSIASTSGKPLDPTAVTTHTAPSHGTISIDPTTGAVKYTPTPGYSGPDSYAVTVCDTSSPVQCSNVTVPVTVGVNTVTAHNDTDSTSVGTPVTTDVESNDTSASGQALANPTVASQPAHGTAVVSGNKIKYTPTAGFSGADSYTYQVCDTSTPTPVCSTATVNVTVNNVFSGGSATTAGVSTPQNQPVATPLSSIASTTGKPLDPTKVTQVTAPAHGSISINPTTGVVTYTPTPGYSGPDTYTVNVCDTSNPVQCTDETVKVAVGVNTVTAHNDTASTPVGTAVTTNVRANDTSASGQALANPTVSSAPSHGTATVNPDGTITYTPTAGYSGPDSYQYHVCDTSTPTPVCSTATVNVIVNNVFTAGPGVTTDQNTPITTPLSGLVMVTGKPVDPTKVTKVSGPAHGTISIDPVTGAVTYTPNHGYSGPDSYVLNVCDTSNPVQCSNVTEHVGVNSNKVTTGGGSAPSKVTTKSGKPVTINPLAGLHSASGQPLGKAFISAKPKHGTAKVNPNGTITYTPAKDFVGTDSYQYTVCDTGTPQACLTRTLTVTVKAAAIVVPGLPDTGGPNLAWWLGGGAAVIAGLMLMVAGRRRKA